MSTDRTTERAAGPAERVVGAVAEGTVGPAVTARVVPPRVPARAPVAPRARRRDPRRRPDHGAGAALALAAADAVALLAAAVTLARPDPPLPTVTAVGIALFALAFSPAASALLYRPGPASAALDELPRLLGHAAVAWCLAVAVLSAAVPWPRLAAAVAAQAALACAGRAVVYHARRRAARRRPRPTLVVGTGRAGQRVAAALAAHPEYGMRPVGLVGPVPSRLPEISPLPVLTTHRDVTRAVAHGGVRDVVLACPPRDRLVRLLWERGCRVWLVDADTDPGAAVVARAVAAARRHRAAAHLWGFACHRLDPPGGQGVGRLRLRLRRMAKRALDVAVAAPVLLLAAPLLAGCALAVRLADGPGVIFRQERVGQDGRRFTILKFRTLRPADDHEAATRWTIAEDRRLSAVGRLLRRTSLDELPQLWNVVRGDMSLVGPRPERPHFVERFSRAYPGYAQRHRAPVGLTGLAQVSGLRGDTSIEDRTRFDNHYIASWSLWQDLRILLRTAAVWLRCGGR
ncbi:exopolysaccharide biosynthesis polyprenyl glycosylphosphotransferase [Streptomyces sp. 4N509B]|uniref:exopolysaccharide biosynthesis polyprenyl glycosylphosphotransferase n=1 Tax=Streptomyces sp. 4N509B TaxID=3457413 RepID=UPI003FD1EEE4